MTETLRAYIALLRLDKPVGIYLLLWPTLWSLWLAGGGQPDRLVFVVFVLGVILMHDEGKAVVYCDNTWGCKAQRKAAIEHFASRLAMNIKGFGSRLIEQLLEQDLFADAGDLYTLEKHREQLVELEGWGR